MLRKKQLSIFGTAILSAFLLFGCGKATDAEQTKPAETEEKTENTDEFAVKDEKNGIPGMYYPIAIKTGDVFLAVDSNESHSSAAPNIALRSDGKGKMVIDGSYGNFTWEEKDEYLEFHFKDEEKTYKFPYENYILSMVEESEDTTIYFGKDTVDYSAFITEGVQNYEKYLADNGLTKEEAESAQAEAN